MNEKDYHLKCISRQTELAMKDKLTDAEKLEWILCDIQPYSKYWRWGMVGALKRAIKAMEGADDK